MKKSQLDTLQLIEAETFTDIYGWVMEFISYSAVIAQLDFNQTAIKKVWNFPLQD